MPEGSTPSSWSVFLASTTIARADLREIYTPFSWSVGWVGRVAAQAVFFAAIGLLLEDPSQIVFLFVGQAVMACVVESFMVIASSSWERSLGTWPLLVASPSSTWPVFVGRSIQWVFSGAATTCLILFVLGPFFGVEWSLIQLPAAGLAVFLTAVGAYSMALTLAALVLPAPQWRNIVSNVGYISVMAICGVVAPVTFWPGWVQIISHCLPVTYGLNIVREVHAPGWRWEMIMISDWTLLISSSIGWLATAAICFRFLSERGRADGSIVFKP